MSGAATARGLRRSDLKAKARTILETLARSRAELSILLTDDAGIRCLNREYRGKDRPTDVLAFPLQEGEFAQVGDALGDVVISLETAKRQAAENGLTPAQEVDRLLVHGVLHLIGYDHEVSPREARRMQRKEKALRTLLAGCLAASRTRAPRRRRALRN